MRERSADWPQPRHAAALRVMVNVDACPDGRTTVPPSTVTFATPAAPRAMVAVPLNVNEWLCPDNRTPENTGADVPDAMTWSQHGPLATTVAWYVAEGTEYVAAVGEEVVGVYVAG